MFQGEHSSMRYRQETLVMVSQHKNFNDKPH